MVPSARKSTPPSDLDDDIVDAALLIADDEGWDNLRLRRVADRTGIPLDALHRRFRDIDAVADAWFRRAAEAMLAPTGRGFQALPARIRLRELMMRWFDALAVHRRVTGEMLATKLYPSHPHHWVPMIFNLSRTIQWLRDAAGLDAGGRRRQIEEIGLTVLFLATLAVWLYDQSPGQERTRRFLDRRLAVAERGFRRFCGGSGPSDHN